MEFKKIPGLNVEILPSPITYEDLRNSMSNNLLIPPRGTSPKMPVTGVSASEAQEVAERLGARLPKLEEITILANYMHNPSSAFGCFSKICLTEWLNCSPEWSHKGNQSRCILNPSWLMQKNGGLTRGSLPDHKFSFVTFRLVRG